MSRKKDFLGKKRKDKSGSNRMKKIKIMMSYEPS